jgi:hypothetical protein
METPQQQASVPNIMDFTQPTSPPEPVSQDALAAMQRSLAPFTPAAPYRSAASYMPSGDNIKRVMCAVAIAAVVVLLIVFLYHIIGRFIRDRRVEDRGWIVYYREGCSACTKQKQILGPYAKFVECNTKGQVTGGYTTHPPLPCTSPLIKGFPFWYNTKTKDSRVGVLDADALKKMMSR